MTMDAARLLSTGTKYSVTHSSFYITIELLVYLLLPSDVYDFWQASCMYRTSYIVECSGDDYAATTE